MGYVQRRPYCGGYLVALGETTAQSGQELLAEFIQYGHQRPFEEIVRRYAGMVFNVCFRITKDKHEAEDATQAVFLTLALQAKRGTDIKALGPWLQQVAKRLSLDSRRSKKRRATREERHQVETTFRRECIEEQTLPSADLDELKTILHEELQKMPAKYRLPLILHYFGGLTREEMAAELNCKPSTLGVRIFRGREMLAGRLSNRGIHISTAMLTVAMSYAVKRAISESLIATTAHAATAMAAGHSGAGMASAHVIGLTRRASGALVIGKVKLAALTLLLTGTSLGAGAKVLGVLPKIDVQRMISNQVQRLMRPLTEPFSIPLRVDARPAPDRTPVARVASAAMPELFSAIPHSTPLVAPVPKAQPAVQVAANDRGNTAVSYPDAATSTSLPVASDRWQAPTPAAKPVESDHAVAAATPVVQASDSTAPASGGAGGGGGAAGENGTFKFADASSKSFDRSLSEVLISANDLIVGKSSIAGNVRSSVAMIGSSTSVSPKQIVQIAALGGTVTQSSDGLLRGWGKIQRTGTLEMNGKVVADGQGIDRTLNLTAISAVETQSDSSAVSTQATTNVQTTAMDASVSSPAQPVAEGNGWFAVNHGRLALPLKASSTDSSMLTWGDDPAAKQLSLVNSVRLNLAAGAVAVPVSDNESAPSVLALLSPDRSDAPNLSQISGVAIGLWQVDPSSGDIASAELNICYDASLANDLGASDASVQLWTFGGVADSWQPVSASSLLINADDHMVSGFAQNFDYFAVSVTPAPGQDASELVAHHLSQIDGGASGASSPTGVPEPVALPMFAAGAALLGRRRRHAAI